MARLIDADKLMEELDNIVYTRRADKVDRHALQIVSAIQNAPTVDAVPLNEVFRVIAGHSKYHGDNILSALICIAEGKDVTPVRPVDAVEVVRCKDCETHNNCISEYIFEITGIENQYCGRGRRKDDV